MSSAKTPTVPAPVKRAFRQPIVGISMGLIGLAVCIHAFFLSAPRLYQQGVSFQTALIVAGLMTAQVLAYQFPVHIRYMTKVYMGSVPLFLMAALLPPAEAAIGCALGVIVGEYSARRQRDLWLSDIATQGGRWTILGLIGSVVVHVAPRTGTDHIPALVVAAIVMWLGDTLTTPILFVPLTGEDPWHIVKRGFLEGGPTEAGQYFLGIIGGMLSMQDVWATTLLLLPIGLLYRTSKRAKELHESTKRLLENMADTVDNRDPFTHNHSVRVTDWTIKLLKELGVVGPEAQLIVTAARVHDIGKMSLPDEILHKHEALTDDEWKIMQTHPAIGADMLKSYPAFARGASIVRGHHERFDGQGYPDKLVGTNIPFGARVLAVVDSYDAMASDRPYRKGMAPERAAAILRGGRGTQWDADIVDAFLSIVEPQFAAASVKFKESGQVLSA